MRSVVKRIFMTKNGNNGIRKYLIYSAGEIVLIVVGVFLAVQLNNWNEDRKRVSLADEYLERLYDEIKADTSYFHFQSITSEKAAASIRVFASNLYQSSIDDESLIESTQDFFNAGAYIPKYNPPRTTFEDLSSSGNISLIKNRSLQVAIVDLYGKFEQHEKSRNTNTDWVLDSDGRLAHELDVLRWDRRSAEIFPAIDSASQAKWIKLNRDDLMRNAALHFWILDRTLGQYSESIQLSIQLLEHMEEEMRR